MMCISSPAGRRLAVARQAIIDTQLKQEQAWLDALDEFDEAATLVAEELIAQGFADMEGD